MALTAWRPNSSALTPRIAAGSEIPCRARSVPTQGGHSRLTRVPRAAPPRANRAVYRRRINDIQLKGQDFMTGRAGGLASLLHMNGIPRPDRHPSTFA